MKAIFNALRRLALRIRIAEYDANLEHGEQEFAIWPRRREVWTRERATLQCELDRRRGIHHPTYLRATPAQTWADYEKGSL